MATLTQLKEAVQALDQREHKPVVWTCARCKLGVADPKVFLNGKPLHFPICFPNKFTR